MELKQPTALSLSGQTIYDFSVDIWSPLDGYSLDIGLTANSTRTSIRKIGIPTRGGPLFNRISFTFAPPSSGQFVLDLALNFWQGRVYRIDNVRVRVAREGSIDFFQARAANDLPNPFTVYGRPNGVFALLLGGGISSTPFKIIGCNGEWLLTLPAFHIVTGGLDQNGASSSTINVPKSIAGIPIAWQVALLPPACTLGCPLEIVFP